MKDYTKINYLVIDVDGTMTDAGIYYDEQGNELKKFCTKDAAGFFAAHQVGIHIIVLTGRKCQAVTRRMKEMHVEFIFQGVKDKKSFLQDFMTEQKISRVQLGYIGDDLNDLPGMSLASFTGCPRDACPEIRSIADYISTFNGGYGAVRDIIYHLLQARGEWDNAIRQVYGLEDILHNEKTE